MTLNDCATMAKAVELLRYARSRIKDGHWTQGTNWGADGTSASLVGHLVTANGGWTGGPMRLALDALARQFDGASAQVWNDKDGRTAQDVLSVIDEAIGSCQIGQFACPSSARLEGAISAAIDYLSQADERCDRDTDRGIQDGIERALKALTDATACEHS